MAEVADRRGDDDDECLGDQNGHSEDFDKQGERGGVDQQGRDVHRLESQEVLDDMAPADDLVRVVPMKEERDDRCNESRTVQAHQITDVLADEKLECDEQPVSHGGIEPTHEEKPNSLVAKQLRYKPP